MLSVCRFIVNVLCAHKHDLSLKEPTTREKIDFFAFHFVFKMIISKKYKFICCSLIDMLSNELYFDQAVNVGSCHLMSHLIESKCGILNNFIYGNIKQITTTVILMILSHFLSLDYAASLQCCCCRSPVR